MRKDLNEGNYIRADIKITTAGESFSRHGKKIGLGKRTSRLVLDENNPHFNIKVRDPQEKLRKINAQFDRLEEQFLNIEELENHALENNLLKKAGVSSTLPLKSSDSIVNALHGEYNKIQKTSSKKNDYVPLMIKDSSGELRKVSVHVHDLSERLHLKPEDIQKHVNEGSLEFLINNQLNKLENISMAVEQYKNISTEKSTISEKKIMKATKKAFRNLEQGKQHFLLDKGQMDFFVYMDKNAFHLHLMGKSFSKGAYGVIYKAISLTSQTSLVIKESMKDPKAQADLKNEDEILSILKHPGIQERPHRLLIEADENAGGNYLISRLYEKGSLNKEVALNQFQQLKQMKKLDRIHNIISALAYMSKENVMHGYIKPDNLLMKDDGTIVIADWGGARIMKKDNNDPIQISQEVALTYSYTLLSEYEKMLDLEKEYNSQIKKVTIAQKTLQSAESQGKTTQKNESQIAAELEAAKNKIDEAIKQRESLRNEYLELRQKMDMWATGAALHLILTGKKHLTRDQYKIFAYPDNPELNPPYNFDRKALEEAGWKGTGMIELIEKMVEPNTELRITAQEAEIEMQRIHYNVASNLI